MKRLPLVLAVILYLLIYFLRSQQAVPAGRQGGLELKIDLFQSERQALDQKISELLPSPQAELLSGILLGQNKKLPGRLKVSLRDTGSLHIVVASGQNLSMVAGFFLYLAGLIKRRNAVILSLLAVLFYTLLTGVQVPILRAAIMFSLASLAHLFGRPKEGWWVLLITAALMLLVSPKWITDLSFQLSFLATFGVVVVSPILLPYLKAIPLLGQDLAVTIAAQLMVMPIIAANFHQVSLVSLAANVMILWTIPPIMILGTLMLVLGSILTLAANVFLTYFIYIVSFFASLPFAWEYVGEQSWMIWLGYYLLLAAGLIMLSLTYAKTTNSR